MTCRASFVGKTPSQGDILTAIKSGRRMVYFLQKIGIVGFCKIYVHHDLLTTSTPLMGYRTHACNSLSEE